MEGHGVVPDVIDFPPADTITVKYPSGVEVNMGNELTPTQVKDQPEVHWPADKNALYTLIMTDPDAPTRSEPKFREILHWLVTDIPGADISKGTTKVEYVGSGPPKDTGLHRYIFLVFKQSGPLTNCDQSGERIEARMHFKTRDFTRKYRLGNPVAGNFYQAQYDDYVPILHAKHHGK